MCSRIVLIAFSFVIPGLSFAIDVSGAPNSLDEKKQHSACPSQEFSAFFNAFSENVETQRAFTVFPLESQHLDLAADPEPKPVLQRLQYNQTRFPVISGASERKLKRLDLRADRTDSDTVKVFVTKADGDYQVVYFFRKSSCWSLYRIEDWSL